MWKKFKGLTNWSTLCHSTTTYLALIILLLIGMVIFQQCQIATLQEAIENDHDPAQARSVYGRLYILEGISNKHGDLIDEEHTITRQLQEELAQQDWRIKQLEWQHPQLQVQSSSWQRQSQIQFDPNPGHVPDVPRTIQE